jgi:hypothetical protein
MPVFMRVGVTLMRVAVPVVMCVGLTVVRVPMAMVLPLTLYVVTVLAGLRQMLVIDGSAGPVAVRRLLPARRVSRRLVARSTESGCRHPCPQDAVCRDAAILDRKAAQCLA